MTALQTMPKPRFSYKGLENISKSEEDRPAFVRFQVTDLATGETLVDFYTNKALEGVFVYDQGAASYRQIAGTMCFRLPSEEEAARRALRKMAFEQPFDD